MKVTLFIPTYNEIDGVKAVMLKINKEWIDEVIIVDHPSTDGTKEFLESLGYNVLIQKEPGLFSAWWQGFEASTGDIIIPFSPDNNSVPEVIPKLVAKVREGYDMVIASRYLDNAKSDDDNVATKVVNFMLSKIVNVLFGAHYTDAGIMYRAFRKDLLTSLKLDRHKSDVFEFLLSIRCAKKKLKVTEIPGDEPSRIGNKRESRAWPGWRGRVRGGLMILKLIFREFLFFDGD